MTTKDATTDQDTIAQDVLRGIVDDLVGHLAWASSNGEKVKELEASDPIAARAIFPAVDDLVATEIHSRLMEEIPQWIAEDREWHREHGEEVD